MAGVADFGNQSLTAFISSQEACLMQYLIAATHALGSSNEGKCPVTFDFLLCWPETEANGTVQMECPASVGGIHYYTVRNVTRHCFANSTWNAKADYSGCAMIDDSSQMFHLKIMYYMYWVGYAVSLVFLLFALGIFLHYKNLWCLRNIIHTNLVLCFTLHNITWICYSFFAHELQLNPTDEGGKGHVLNLCIIPTTLLKYFIAAGFFWMFVEGFYLFVNVMFSFHAQRIRFWMCCIVGWGVPFVLIVITSIAKKANFSQNCWDEQQHYLDYIFIGPVLFLLCINLIFLFLIMYVVMAKLQLTVHAELERYKKGVKALLVLCPLLGINYVLVLAQPSHPDWLKLTFGYYCVLISSTQGLLVALFFCFRNNEVREFMSKSCARMRRRLRLTGNVSMTTRNSHSDIVSTNATTEGRTELLSVPPTCAINGHSNRTSPKMSTTSLPGRGGWMAPKQPTLRQKNSYQNVIMFDHTGRLYSATRGHGLFQSNPALVPYRTSSTNRPSSARKSSHSESEGMAINSQTTF